jgi:excisionase family DNA binding protein
MGGTILRAGDRGAHTQSPEPAHTEAPPIHGPPDDAVLTVDELAALLRVNRKTIYDAFQRGELPGGRRIGRTIRFARAVILAWLNEGDRPARGRSAPRAPHALLTPPKRPAR